MNIADWRTKKEEGERFTLPSGLEVRLRRIQLLDLAQRGQIPTPLVGTANALLSSEQLVTIESFTQFGEVINLIVTACLVDPVVAEEPGENAITIEELSSADRMAIYNWVNDILVRVRPFREEPRGTEDPAPAGADL